MAQTFSLKRALPKLFDCLTLENIRWGHLRPLADYLTELIIRAAQIMQRKAPKMQKKMQQKCKNMQNERTVEERTFGLNNVSFVELIKDL